MRVPANIVRRGEATNLKPLTASTKAAIQGLHIRSPTRAADTSHASNVATFCGFFCCPDAAGARRDNGERTMTETIQRQAALMPFLYGATCVRTLLRGEEPWFVAIDVCRILEIRNSRDAVNNLDEDEKGVAITDTPGGMQEMNIVSEPGLYKLIFRSRKPEAKRFTRWVTHEVLPAIRRQGAYGNMSRMLEEMKAYVRKVEAALTESPVVAYLPDDEYSGLPMWEQKVMRYIRRRDDGNGVQLCKIEAGIRAKGRIISNDECKAALAALQKKGLLIRIEIPDKRGGLYKHKTLYRLNTEVQK